MSDPVKYTPDYSFTNWQANNPKLPLPANRVDDEYANIAISIGQAIDGLMDIRRSDGELVNGIVTADSLSPTLKIGFTFRGNWTVDTQYNAGDGVVFNTGFYSATVAHLSTASNDPEDPGNPWTFLYSVDDLVTAGAVSIQKANYTGDGVTTVFAVPIAPASINNVLVEVGTVVLRTAQYSVSGTNVTISPAPVLGAPIELRVIATIAVQELENAVYTARDVAIAKAAEADASADAALQSETNAAGYASSAAGSATNAGNARDFANDWATQAEDVPVNDGVNPSGFSAYHWSQKAMGYVGNQIGPAIHAAPVKATPADADEIGIADSAASWVLKRLSFTNLYAALNLRFLTGKTVTSWTDAERKLARQNVGIASRKIFGLTLSNNITDAVNDIDVSAGDTCSNDPVTPRQMYLTADMGGRQLDALWGTGNGMRDIGSISDNTWHVHLIERPDTQATSILASLAHDHRFPCTLSIASPGIVSCGQHGLQIGGSFVFDTDGTLPTGVTAGTRYFVLATGLTQDSFQFSATQGGAAINTSGSQSGQHYMRGQPVLPANYTHYRRIGSIQREAGALVDFRQIGNLFQRAPKLDRSSTAAAVNNQIILSVPRGLNVLPYFVSRITPNVSSTVINVIGSWHTGSANVTFQIANSQAPGGGSDDYAHIPPVHLTNRTQQLYWTTNIPGGTAIANQLQTLGWIDERGQDYL